MPVKKGGKKKHSNGAGQGQTSHLANLTSTKKQFPQLNKLNHPKKSYVSPYSIKTLSKP